MSELAPRVRLAILFFFWALVAVFVFTLLTMLAPDLRDTISDAMLWQAGVLFVLGGLLCLRTMRAPVERTLKLFLLLAGGSVVGVVLCFLLHNFTYALGTVAGNARILGALLSALEVAFFLGAVIVFPAAFVISAAGVIVMLVRARGTPHHPTTGGLKPAA